MPKRLLFLGLLFALLGLIGACQAAPTDQSSVSAKTITVYRPST
ncbi:MAG: hypothetical protein NZP34_10210 [Caldilineales bacterium]|nr:hypothetical protein [Caldilineales bacterium]MCX7852160.1 hypothetical protein [Caldilineales bacterium]